MLIVIFCFLFQNYYYCLIPPWRLLSPFRCICPNGDFNILRLDFYSGIAYLPGYSAPGYSFRILDWTCYHRTPYLKVVFSTGIYHRGVPGFATDCPRSAWCRWSKTYLLYVSPLFGNLVLGNSPYVWHNGKRFFIALASVHTNIHISWYLVMYKHLIFICLIFMFQTVLSFAKSIEFFFQRRDFDPLYKKILGLVIFQLNQHHRNHKTKPTQQLPALHYKKYSTRWLRDHHHNYFYIIRPCRLMAKPFS